MSMAHLPKHKGYIIVMKSFGKNVQYSAYSETIPVQEYHAKTLQQLKELIGV